MPLMMFNNLNIDAEDSRIKDDMLRTIEDDREGLLHFLHSFLQAQDVAGSTNMSADIVNSYLSKRNIRTVSIHPPKGPSSLTSLINQSEGPSLVMSALLCTSTTDGPAPVSVAVPKLGSKRPMSWKRESLATNTSTTATKASTVALTAAYTYLHHFRAHIPGTLTFLALSDDSIGSSGSLEYLLHEDDRKELFRGECVLDASPTNYNTVQMNRDFDFMGSRVLADALRRNAEGALGATGGVEFVQAKSYTDAWRNVGVPVCSFGMEEGRTGDGGGGEEGVDVEEFLGLVRVFALAGWDYMRSEGSLD